MFFLTDSSIKRINQKNLELVRKENELDSLKKMVSEQNDMQNQLMLKEITIDGDI